MRIFREHEFGNIRGIELGWSPVGRPLMTAFCYIAGTVMIDTGPPHMQNAVCDLVRSAGIDAVLLTHYHEDHSGNASVILNNSHASVYGCGQTVEKLSRPYPMFPYQHLMWGANSPVRIEHVPDQYSRNDFVFEPIHTPGHSKDHTVYLEQSRGWLFSGDLYLSDRIKYFRADEHIDEQIESLKKVLALDFDALFCGHRPRPENGKEYIRRKLQFLEDLYGSIKELAVRGMDASAIMKQLDLKEDRLIKMICFGNVSMKNIVRSAIRAMNGGRN